MNQEQAPQSRQPELSLSIGSLTIQSPFWLAPLAGYTNRAFRRILWELGGLGFAVSELVHARSLIERRSKALEIIRRTSPEEPFAVQLFGAVEEEMVAAARRVEELGYPAVDINMGCPVPKVVRAGAGAALLKDVDRAAKLVERVVKAVTIPVTVKMRLGWDPDHFTAPELARRFEEIGVAAVVVHGRWRSQGFSGSVHYDGIRAVVTAVKRMPVLGNGDVRTPLDAASMMKRCGCRGVSIGRGAFFNPWIFQQTSHYFLTGELLPPPTVEDRVRIMCRHLEFMIDELGEPVACIQFRKIAAMYTVGIPHGTQFRRLIQNAASKEAFYKAVELLLKKTAEGPSEEVTKD